MTLRDDVRIVREYMIGSGVNELTWEALDRIEEALALPKVADRGFYQYAESGMYFADGEGHWFEVPNGYSPSDYPNHLKDGELIRLVREDEK